MKIRHLFLPATLALAACNPAPPAATEAEVTLEDDGSKFSYSAGYEIGQRLNDMGGVEVAPDAMMAGLQDALNDAEARLDAEEMNAVKSRVYKAAAEERNKQREAVAAEAGERGAAFLAENKSKEGVQETESGLQYMIVEEGEGNSPDPTDTVVVHYRGTLLDGTEFDSSYKRGQPATFPLNRVIAGWTEGLQLMKEGAKYRFTIPPALGYGKRGVPGTIPPDSTLVFEVELIEVQ